MSRTLVLCLVTYLSYPPSCTLYIVGVVFLVMLPNEKFSRRNFFDENALMAGLVKREFTDLGSLADFASKLKAVASDE